MCVGYNGIIPTIVHVHLGSFMFSNFAALTHLWRESCALEGSFMQVHIDLDFGSPH